MLSYWVMGGIALAVAVAMVTVAWRLVELMRLYRRQEGEGDGDVVETQEALDVVYPRSSGLVEVALLDTVELADGVLMYVVRLNDRVLLLARYKEQIAAVGDYPLSWLSGEGDARTWRPVAVGEVEQRRTPAGARLVRDERQWERQRDMLIRMLQERGQ